MRKTLYPKQVKTLKNAAPLRLMATKKYLPHRRVLMCNKKEVRSNA